MDIPYGKIERYELGENLFIVGIAEKTREDADITGERMAACWNFCSGVNTDDLVQEKVEIVSKESHNG